MSISRRGKRDFFLVTAKADELMQFTDYSSGTSEFDQQLLHEHVLKNLKEMRQHQDASTTNDGDGGYENFIIQGPNKGNETIQRLVLEHPDTISAIATAFQQEANAGRKSWKTLKISNCDHGEPLQELLIALKRGGLFPKLELFYMSFVGYAAILRLFCTDNPKLTHLFLQGSSWGNDFLELSVGTQLRRVLDTTSSASGTTTTRLEFLMLRSFEMDTACIEQLATGLRCNDSIHSLTLEKVDHPSGLPATLLDSLEGQKTLQILDLGSNKIPPPTLLSLGRILKHPSCRITTLDLRRCRSSELDGEGGGGEVAVFDRLRTSLVVNALQGCQSLTKLLLNSEQIEPLQEHCLLGLVDTCPVLHEIDLSGDFSGEIEVPFWGPSISGRNQKTSPAAMEARKSLFRLILEDNPIICDIPERSAVVSYDKDMQELLKRYPALGEINRLDSWHNLRPFVSFSQTTNELLAFNYAGRGRLMNGNIPSALWPLVLQRVRRAGRNGLFFLKPQKTSEEFTGLVAQLAVSSHASVLFSLLKQDPLRVTLESCHSKESFPTELLLSIYETPIR